MSRIHNFSAGPAVLPEPVIKVLQRDLWSYGNTGLGIVECSHRSAAFDAIVQSAKANLRSLLKLSDDQVVLFLHGGARSQFYQFPMNTLRGGTAAYIDTGTWSFKAAQDASRYGQVHTVWSSKSAGYDHVPEPNAWGKLPEGCKYLHYTSNNTVAGSEFFYRPEVPKGVWLACDMSSNFLSRPMECSQFDYIYAGAQKNLGPSGVCVVILRRSLLDEMTTEIPQMLQYGMQVEKDSMLNTPCTFAIHAINEVTKWLIELGGVQAIEEQNNAQASKIYDFIDNSELYRGKVHKGCRSKMNITFTTGDDSLDTSFWKQAADQGLSGLKGHRSVGGLRASIYNAQTNAAIDALVDYMHSFEQQAR